MPSPTRRRASRSASRGRKQPVTPPEMNGNAKESVANIVVEARTVEAILARRPCSASSRNSQCGMWAAVVTMEVVFFVWLKWAVDTYLAYRAANP
ncbi:hypothetical protein LSM04_001599 [Trypanosoma melophagium]|uniref:uncharacterized protein n=1 Tax=Trypanosoma melophagium TaxID=715481 RepID=UPI00351A6BB4|nr:hypothetical protein LSM04_001599 [Trypanosoma melophagium]